MTNLQRNALGRVPLSEADAERLYVVPKSRIDVKGVLESHERLRAEAIVLEELRKDADLEIDRLRAALKPFADQARIVDACKEAVEYGPFEEAFRFGFFGELTEITVGDCRKALKALEPR